MQKKDIKIGECYGILAHVNKRAKAKVGATVVDFDGVYQGYTTGGFSSRRVEKHGGITVKFDRPVVKRWDGYIYLDEIVAEDSGWVEDFKEQAVKDAITTDVLPSARHVVGLWSEITAERKIETERLDEWKAENRRKAEAFTPRREAISRALIEAGIDGEVKITVNTQDVGDGKKDVTSYRQILISTEALEKLLTPGFVTWQI